MLKRTLAAGVLLASALFFGFAGNADAAAVSQQSELAAVTGQSVDLVAAEKAKKPKKAGKKKCKKGQVYSKKKKKCVKKKKGKKGPKKAKKPAAKKKPA